MELLIKPSKASFTKAKQVINLIDKTQYMTSGSSTMISKIAKDIQTIKVPVTRYFESPTQLTYMYAESEYDLVSAFKLFKYEAYFLKATQKKHGLLCKSGFSVHSDNDEVKKYINNRFKIMQLQTGISLEALIKKISFYLIVCSNSFVIKVRSDDTELAKSYKRDGKELKPIVGLFTPHPTTMKPKFKYVKDASMKTGIRLALDKWVHTSRRGIQKEFDPADVAHFTLFKEDGMVFGMPEVMPVIDDIRTLRKIEEDIQLLIYRDLFPIIHYTVENPRPIDHHSGVNELDKAQKDMQRLASDGGIATDERHKIQFVGNEGKSLDVNPYLTYFQKRVFAGLGVSPIDMGDGAQIRGDSADTLSGAIIDAVKFIQQELASQFKEEILDEMMLQSDFPNIFDEECEVKLLFQEIDLEWKIRSENHEADLFSKGVKTIHETRNKMGQKTISDDDINDYTFHGMQAKRDMDELDNKNAAKADMIKSSKTNSNVTKSKDSLQLSDSISNISLQDEFKLILEDIYKDEKSKKFNLIIATKVTYDRIKKNVIDSIKLGMETAAKDLELSGYDKTIKHNIFEKIDQLRDSVTNRLKTDQSYINMAANRVGMANKTETIRGYNYGYGLVCLSNEKDKFTTYSDITSNDFSGLNEEITLTYSGILNQVPPYKPNSKTKIRVKLD